MKKMVFLGSVGKKIIKKHVLYCFVNNANKEATFLGFPRLTSLLSTSVLCFGPAMEKSKSRNTVPIWKEKSQGSNLLVGQNKTLCGSPENLEDPKAL